MAGELGCDILQNQNLLSGAFFLMVKKKIFSIANHTDFKICSFY